MARIQILELPSEEVGNAFVTPFAIIVDQCSEDELTAGFANDLAKFRDMCGARAALATTGVLDVPSFTADEIATINQRPCSASWEPVDMLRAESIERTTAYLDALAADRAKRGEAT